MDMTDRRELEALIAKARKTGAIVTVETDEATGAPVYATDDISIGFPQETERFEYVLQDGEKIVNYSIGPADGFDIVPPSFRPDRLGWPLHPSPARTHGSRRRPSPRPRR